jgi:hypothetical protein
MLIRFSVANWRSIRSEQEISFVASALKNGRVDTFASPALNERLLPALAIYGANASGKSNVIEALRVLRSLVIRSHRTGAPGEKLPIDPFRLDREHSTKPTAFMLEFILSDVRYQYALTVTAEKVVEESLYAFPSKRPQLWYARDEEGFDFGRKLKGKNTSIQELTRPNSLFLSAAATSNHEQLTLIFNFFRDQLVLYDEIPAFPQATNERHVKEEDKKARLVSILKHADIGIEDILERAQPENEKAKALTDDLKAVLKKHIGGNEEMNFELPKMVHLQLVHRGSDGFGEFSMASESRGTIQLLNLLPAIFDALEAGSTLLVDEIDTSLHPLLAREVVRFFQSKETNRKGAQLIFTTHDVNLLTRDVLRRDQIWFTEKDHCGASTVFPLTDIKTRSNDNIQKAYLEGRYGAVPYLKRLTQILADENALDDTALS